MATDPGSLSIPARFCGPEKSGNGGFSAGLVAEAWAPGESVEVTLLRPPPLLRPLRLEDDRAAGVARLWDGGHEVAVARRAVPDVVVPSAPSFTEAEALSARYTGHEKHGFPFCFACGPARAPGDGLRIFAGRSDETGPVAAPFIPDASLAGADGWVRPEIVWAAIDCAGYFGVAGAGTPLALLGRMTAALSRPLAVGERCVVLGWGLGGERRKLFAGTALIGEDGAVLARARQVWITIRAPGQPATG